jgi:hypothetical protein
MVVMVALVATGLLDFGCARDQANLTAPASQQPSLSVQRSQQQGLGRAIAAQERHTDRLLAMVGVVGTAVGLARDGQPAVKIYTKAASVAGLPEALEGIPVVVEVTGSFVALQGGGVDNTAIFTPPVPIGVSTGNEGQCSAGTISARVKDATNVYALSNNHVYALENTAPIGSRVLQPGLFDTGCVLAGNNLLGTLFAFQPIVFKRKANNTIDAAIALSSTAELGNATPTGAGYGTPNHATVPAAVNQPVQKYGRTTSLTHGTVTAINATVLVGYSSGNARFVNQIIVQSGTQFIGAGDSGSLLVTDDVNDNPVGLLFAGNGSGTLAVANPIDLVLTHFGVTVDGK